MRFSRSFIVAMLISWGLGVRQLNMVWGVFYCMNSNCSGVGITDQLLRVAYGQVPGEIVTAITLIVWPIAWRVCERRRISKSK